jgi:phosphohistidine phosphatase SixA
MGGRPIAMEHGVTALAEDSSGIGRDPRREMTRVGLSWAERSGCWAKSNGPKGRL